MANSGDQIAAFRAKMDQAIASFQEMAGGIAAFWKRLVSDGLPPDTATAITITYVASMIQKLNFKSDEPDNSNL